MGEGVVNVGRGGEAYGNEIIFYFENYQDPELVGILFSEYNISRIMSEFRNTDHYNRHSIMSTTEDGSYH